MELIYTNRAAQEIVKDEQMYKQWLSELREGDLVLAQKFSPPAGSFNYPFEKWIFEVAEFRGDEIIRETRKSNLNKATGWVVHEDGATLFYVFPIRIVPLSGFIKIGDQIGNSVVGHHPIYEPLFLGKFRHVYYISHGDPIKFSYAASALMEIYPMSYKVDARNYMNDTHAGEIYHCFGDKQPQVIEGASYLYSQEN
jgi:hypothetical protein